MTQLPKVYPAQTLVIILLGTSVALTVALAVSIRTAGTLRQTTSSAQAQAALAAAEAGAEVGLQRLQKNDPDCLDAGGCGETDIVLADSITKYTYTVTQTGASGDAYIFDLPKDQTQEIKLTGYLGATLKVCWYDLALDGSPEKNNAVEMIYVYEPSPDVFALAKYAYNGTAGLVTSFDAPPAAGSVSVAGRITNFNHCQTVPPTGSLSSPRLLRIKALFNNLTAAVQPTVGADLPVQSYRVLSTGTTLDEKIKKTIRVTKTLPALPGIFDFGLYSGSETQSLTK